MDEPSDDKGWLWLEVLHRPTGLSIAVMSGTKKALGFSDVMRMLVGAINVSRGESKMVYPKRKGRRLGVSDELR